jgi:hypothetical protein
MKLGAFGRHPAVRHLTDLAMKILPVGVLVAIGSYVAAQQAVSPHRRVIKIAVLMGLMALMLRFDMVYSVYLFTVLFPFPSGVSIGSTNSILMTLIPLIWAIRAISTKTRVLIRRTKVDSAIVLFVAAYVISFFNVDTTGELTESLKIMWTTATAITYFYLIVTFANTEDKLFTLVKVTAVVCGFVMLTAVVELAMPGRTLIPGWMGFEERLGEGTLGYRIRGMRVGGVLKNQGMVSDFGTRTLFLLVLLMVRTRNPYEKMFWGGVSLLTIAAVVATANRGAFFSLVIGLCYVLYLFRKEISITRIIIILGVVASLLATSEILLTKYTYATSLSKRILITRIHGVVPDTRKNTWVPALRKSFEHPFIGHGPFYDIRGGLGGQMWPHNCFIYFFYTVGLFGLLAFLAVVFRVWRYSLSYRLPRVRGSPLADLCKVLNGILIVTLLQQLRTDFQRGNVAPYFVWMVFGLIVATGVALENLSQSTAPDGPDIVRGGTGEARRRVLPRRRQGRIIS